MRKSNGIRGLMAALLVMLAGATPYRPPTSSQGHAARIAAQTSLLQQRMDAFIAAVRTENVDSIAAFFPRSGEWRYSRTAHTSEGPRAGTWRIPAGDTRRAISGTELASSFRVDNEQVIGLLAHQLRSRPGSWRLVAGNRFVPPGADASSATYISWRRENGTWVISVVADESFSGPTLPSWCC